MVKAKKKEVKLNGDLSMVSFKNGALRMHMDIEKVLSNKVLLVDGSVIPADFDTERQLISGMISIELEVSDK